MCGISGVYSPNIEINKNLLHLMGDTQKHRGPDNFGYFLNDEKDVGFAHNRLSILDISQKGNQPMESHNNRFVIVFNGEIYNFKDLKNKFFNSNISFESGTDTEVLLNLYSMIGKDMLSELNGMFSFAIFDKLNREIILARDRVGIKPLYYFFDGYNFAFSSELKPILKLPFVSREINLDSLESYFTLGYVPGDQCIFNNIKKLEPGKILTYSLEECHLTDETYWDPNDSKMDLSNYNEEELSLKLEELLQSSVKMRMISDVPIGSFLSGGIDSSIVSTILSKSYSGQIKTYNISFNDNRFDESPMADRVSKAIGSDHTKYNLDINAIDILPQIINNFDEPFADSSMIPTYFVSKVASKEVKVILSGDGADELFGGYNWYSWMLKLERLNYLKQFSPIASKLFSSLSIKYGSNFIYNLGLSSDKQYINRISLSSPSEIELLLNKRSTLHPKENKVRSLLELDFKSSGSDLIEKMTKFDFKYYLPDDILTKVDRASMAHSLETRVPWLDHRLVEFSYGLQSSNKIRNGELKYLPKKLLSSLLPSVDFNLGVKKGFSIPCNDWMRGEMGVLLKNLVAKSNDGSVSNFLNFEYITKKLNYHILDKKSNQGPHLFSILIFMLWSEKYT